MILGTAMLLLICSPYVIKAQVDVDGAYYRGKTENGGHLIGKELPSNIAVIGGGVGGTSAAFFLRNLFGSDVPIDLYEPGSLCGRVATISMNGRSFESGGSIIHGKNLYAKEFLKKFDLEPADRPQGTMSIFDGTNFILQTTTWWIINLIKMLLTFGFDLFRLQLIETKFIDMFESIYGFQSDGQCFTSPHNLLQATGKDTFINATKTSSCELFRNIGVSDFTINNLVSSGIRANYGQSCKVHGFVGMVSMAGIQSKLWSVKGGNKLLCQKLLENSNVYHIKEKAVKLAHAGSNRFKVVLPSGSASEYDIIVVATPIIENKSHLDVTEVCSSKLSCPTVTSTKKYQQTVATFVDGELNSEVFKCDSRQNCPQYFLITKGEIFYRSIGLHFPVDFSPETDNISTGVYKVFSESSLTQKQLESIFKNFTTVKEKIWQAYPKYSPPENLGSFVINEHGVYYTSSMEWAASAIEMSIISAKNSALLAFNHWNKITKNIDVKVDPNLADKTEL